MYSPLISCICVTRDRRKWITWAIRYFLAQTYENKELFILSDGEDISDLIPKLNCVKHEHLDDVLTIGAKRNLACSRVKGEFIAHWDDDDYSAPTRLADQIAKIQESKKAVTGYHTMKFTDGKDWWMYQGTGAVALGTSLLYRRDWWSQYAFESKLIGEDNAFVHAALTRQQFKSYPGCDMADRSASALPTDLMYATIHADNTSKRVIVPNSNWVPLA